MLPRVGSRAAACAALLLLLAAAGCATHKLHPGNDVDAVAAQQAAETADGLAAPLPPPLPPPSLACALGGSVCPTEPAERPSLLTSAGGGNSDVETEPHKALWPLDRADALGLGLAALALLLAASSGIGGGAILVPLYLLVLGEGISTYCGMIGTPKPVKKHQGRRAADGAASSPQPCMRPPCASPPASLPV